MADKILLMTPWGESLEGIPLQEYPRPQMRRDSYICLNGEWELAITKNGDTHHFDRTITVPFAPQSVLSGVETEIKDDALIYYRRTFTLPDGFNKGRVLLHFGGVDQIAEITVNGHFLCRHEGGFDAFCVDITSALEDENELTVAVCDRLDDCIYPYGKQRHRRGGMWYTPVTGIWQTVWLESVPENYIKGLKIDADSQKVLIAAQGVSEGVVTIIDGSERVCLPLVDGKAEYAPEHPICWSPENPHLYEFYVESGEDRVDSYFALRSLSVELQGGYPRLCLNGKPYFFHGLLDQGYFSDGIYTPADYAAYEYDILKMKKLGFNMLRKHIKVEPEQFYYLCDRLGMVVFQDMVNNGKYSFFRDTALPTAGVQRLWDGWLHLNKRSRMAFEEGMKKTVNQLYNHPCICCWTIFNEGWGQFCADKMYDRLKAIDASRFIDATSGWFRRKRSDVDSRHVYFRKVELTCRSKPLFLSEFGGYSFKPAGHVFNTEKTYGYGKFDSREKFVDALRLLYLEQIVPLAEKGLSAAVYTQVSDVEDETNGLLSYDRKFEKVLPEEFADISEKLKDLTSNL